MPPKKRRVYNTSGLRNQQPKATDNPNPSQPCPDESDTEDSTWQPNMVFDSLKVDVAAEDVSDDELMEEGDEVVEWDSQSDGGIGLGSEGLQVMMLRLAIELGDDPRDEDWMPPALRANPRKGKQGKSWFHSVNDD